MFISYSPKLKIVDRLGIEWYTHQRKLALDYQEVNFMTQNITASSLTLPDITPDKLQRLNYDILNRQQILRQIISAFEARYGFSLPELERKLENREIEEHPAWEDSIEWRNALEQLNSARLSEKIFQWLQNLLTRSPN